MAICDRYVREILCPKISAMEEAPDLIGLGDFPAAAAHDPSVFCSTKTVHSYNIWSSTTLFPGIAFASFAFSAEQENTGPKKYTQTSRGNWGASNYIHVDKAIAHTNATASRHRKC